jgi:enoyl-CoA hydratase
MEQRELILIEQNRWFELTIHRPAALNALTGRLLEELAGICGQLRERPEIRGMIVTGGGDKAFVAGADITELAGLDSAGAQAFARRGQKVFDDLEGCGKPVIAAVNGYALGGGCELALACHIRLLARTAKIGLPEVSLGVIPGYGGTQRLARIVGVGRALQMILTGDPITAEEAWRTGLANQICEPAELLEAARAMAGRMNSRSPSALRLSLEAVLEGRNLPLPEALALEASCFGRAALSDDWREGTAAFLAKRKPEFSGR